MSLTTLILSNIALIAGCAKKVEPTPTISQDILQNLASEHPATNPEETIDSTYIISEETKEPENNIPSPSALYRIASFMTMPVNDSTHPFVLIEDIETSKNYEVDISNLKINKYITIYKDEILLQIEFDKSGYIQNYTILDKFTREDLTNLSEDEFLAHFNLDDKYEQVKMGYMPFTINISEYELNKIYIFDVPTGCYPTLEIINDTNINVISVQQKEVRKSDENDPSYIAQYRRTFELNNGTHCSISPCSYSC